jgi:hypothetical protein
MRMAIRADVIRQPGPYMWVQLAESPLGLGQLYVRKPFQCKGKVEIRSGVGGKLRSSILGNSNDSVRSCFVAAVRAEKMRSEWQTAENLSRASA